MTVDDSSPKAVTQLLQLLASGNRSDRGIDDVDKIRGDILRGKFSSITGALMHQVFHAIASNDAAVVSASVTEYSF